MSKQKELKQAKIYFEEGKAQTKARKLEDGVKLYEQAIAIYEKWEIWEDWVKTSNEIVHIFYYLTKNNEGIKRRLQIFDEIKKRLGKEHLLLGDCAYELGLDYDFLGKYELAIHYFQHSLVIRKKNLAANHFSVAKSINSIGGIYFQKGDYELATNYTKQALLLYKANFGENHIMVGNSMMNLGLCYHNKGNYDLAIDHQLKALVIRKKGYGQRHFQVGVSLSNIGDSYQAKGDYALAIRYNLLALDIIEQEYGKEHFHVASSLLKLGNCHLFIADYDLALNYYETCLKIWKKNLGGEHPNIAHSLQKIGDCYFFKGKKKLAIDYLQKALSIRKVSLGVEHPLVAACLTTIGNFHATMTDNELAISFHKDALGILQKKLGRRHPDIAKCLNNLGACYADLEDYESAISYFQKALIAVTPSFDSKDIYSNPDLKGYSNGYALLDTFNRKAKILMRFFILKNNNVKYLQAALSTMSCAVELVKYIRLSYKTDESKHTLAEKTAQTFNLSIDIALTISEAYEQLKEIPHQKEFANIPYTFQAAKELVFDFLEQSKAVLLLSQFKEKEAQHTSNLPMVLLEKEQQIKIELNYLEKSINTQKAKGDKKDEELLSKFQRKYFEQKQQYDALIEQFEADYPEYYQLKYSVSTASVQDLQSYLQESNTAIQHFNSSTIKPFNHSAILSYHIADDKIYIFAITSNDYQIETVEKPADFSKSIEKLQGDIQLGYAKEFVKSATHLFDVLLQPVWDFLQESSKLIIIPHGELYYVPFDVLLNQHQITDTKNFQNLPYLIRDFDISYHYSATLLLHSHKRALKTSEQADSFFGLAPVHFGGEEGSEKKEGYVVKSGGKQAKRSRRILKSSGNVQEALQDLEETEAEVKEVYQLFEEQGKEAIALFYDQANKQNLQEHIGGYKYVLISTHGFLQEMGKSTLSGIHLAPSNSTVSKTSIKSPLSIEASTEHPSSIHKASTASIESDNFILHTSETYHLNLNADLVVLSSCESGVGELKVGEGMMALNRGFLYAGASNIVYSLFKVPQDSTSQLTQALFRHILEGNGYAQALRKAKLELIADEMMEPMDWAGFALVGG